MLGACSSEDLCDDTQDNDADGLTDCLDSECFGDGSGTGDCSTEGIGLCGDGEDNDGDGLLDCGDDDCFGIAPCDGSESICDDAEDNDNNGLADCADTACFGPNNGCGNELDGSCTDGLDNDLDGDGDCADSDCFGEAGCETEAICNDGQDNNDDGLVDCFDPDCFGSASCDAEIGELCADGQDNDGDGNADCDDDECTDSGYCGEFDCTDGESNEADDAVDFDDAIDCSDDDCDGVTDDNGFAICFESCDDDRDNDGNGLTDCEDPECADNQVCVESNCDDNIDSDGDLLTDCEDDDCWGLGCHNDTETGIVSTLTDGDATLMQKYEVFDWKYDRNASFFTGSTNGNSSFADCFDIDTPTVNDNPFNRDNPFTTSTTFVSTSAFTETGEAPNGTPQSLFTVQRIDSFSSVRLDGIAGTVQVDAEVADGSRVSRTCDWNFDSAVFRGPRDGRLELVGTRAGFTLEGNEIGAGGPVTPNEACQLQGSSFLPTVLFHADEAGGEPDQTRFRGDGVLRVDNFTGPERYGLSANNPAFNTYGAFEQVAEGRQGSAETCLKYYTHYTSTYGWNANGLYGNALQVYGAP
ncbi:MAG: hypothetical protein ACJAZO_000290 [Myxococcota bacterium]